MSVPAFQAAINVYKKVPNLSHQQVVMRLYRHALRNIISWSESRDVLNVEGSKIRAEFDAHKHHAADSAIVQRLVREAKERLAAQTHPDPYIQAYMPGGSLFMRNPAYPYELFYPEGIPEGVSTRRLNIDMSNVPEGQQYADPVYVDSVNKLYWIEK